MARRQTRRTAAAGPPRMPSIDVPAHAAPLPDALALVERASKAIEARRFDEALADLDEAIRLDPTKAGTHVWKGAALSRKGDLSAALASFVEAVRLDPQCGHAFVWRADTLRRLGRMDEALADLDEALRLAPSDANALMNRGTTREETGDHAGAVTDYAEAIRVAPDDPAPWYCRGRFRHRRGDYVGAVEDFDTVLRLAPQDARGFRERGRALVELGRHTEAVKDYGEGLQFRPDHAPLYRDRGVARSWLNDHDGAIADYARAIALNPKDSRAVLFRAQAFFHLREFDDAERDIAEALRLDPEYADAYLWRGRLRRYEEDIDAALADFTEAIRLDPSEADAFRRRGGAWTEAGDYEKAVADFSEAIRLEPDSPAAHAGRADALAWLGRTDQSNRDYETADRLKLQKSEQDDAMSDQQTLVYPLLRDHFAPLPLESLSITERTFPARVRADLQRAIEAVVSTMTVRHFGGVRKRYAHEGTNLTDLCVRDRNDPPVSAPPQYEEMDIGEENPLRCLKGGLWLLEQDGSRFAVYVGLRQNRCGDSGVRFQVATADDEAGRRLTESFFAHLEKSVREARSYRGKILSLEVADRYSGASSGIKVHKLRSVDREQVILPRRTLDLLERNVVGFVRNRPKLAELGLATKKGLLFYGPPGTGKTHTIHYLAGALEGTTTLLIAAEQVGLLGEYMTLARLLAPSMVVIEDADLIARDRGSMNSPCEEALLNKLLNEMDGLRESADILFVLTTNRPEALEAALAGRPGRVDQAIEFPFPDEEGRTKLVHLYARGLEVPEEVVTETVRRTENVSAAFIKELMRRSAQFRFERGGEGPLTQADVDDALDELLFSGGTLNRRLLGGGFDEAEEGVCGAVSTD